jgi:hypothetical protein
MKTAVFLVGLCLGGLAPGQSQVWAKRLDASATANEVAFRIRVTGTGLPTVLSVRRNRVPYEGAGELVLQRLTTAGAVSWTQIVQGRTGNGLRPLEMRVDASGNVIVASFDGGGELDFLAGVEVRKFNGATGAQMWLHRFDPGTVGPSLFGKVAMALDPSGNVGILGTEFPFTGPMRFRVAKLVGSTGAVAWDKVLTRAAPKDWDVADDIVADSSGNFGCVGVTGDSPICADGGSAEAYLTIKVRATDGAVLWTKLFAVGAGKAARWPKIVRDSANNFVIGGTTETSGGGGERFTLVKYTASNGTQSWFRHFANNVGSPNNQLTDLLMNSANEVLAGGPALNSAFTDGYTVLKVDANNVQKWVGFVADYDQSLSPIDFTTQGDMIALDGANEVFVAGQRQTGFVGTRPISQVVHSRLRNTNGTTFFSQSLTPVASSTSSTAGIAVGGGAIWTTGNAATGSTNDPTERPYRYKLNPTNGGPLVTTVVAVANQSGLDWAGAIDSDPSSNLFVAGARNGRMLVGRFTPAGAQTWLVSLDESVPGAPASLPEVNVFIRRDSGGNVVVAGNNRADAWVLKLNGGTGAVIWQRRFDFRQLNGMTIDGSNNPSILLSGFPPQCLKLNQGTGATVWTRNYDGPGQFDVTKALVTDSAGNVYVTGWTSTPAAVCGNPSDTKVYTVRYAASNGTQNWAKTLAPAILGFAEPVGVRVDPSGMVIVAGSIQNSNSVDYFGVRYRNTDGLQMWSQRYDNAVSCDLATDMTLDGSGNLIVTGVTPKAGGVGPYTVRALNATGAQSWESLRPVTPGNVQPTDVQTDAAGNVFLAGGNSTSAGAVHFMTRLVAATGAQAWNVLRSGASTADGGGARLRFAANGKLHLFANTFTPATRLDATLAQYNP